MRQKKLFAIPFWQRFRNTISNSISPSLVISLLALGVSGSTFYFNFLRVNDELALTPLRVVDLESRSTRLANQGLEVAIINTGNRDAVFVHAEPACWDFDRKIWAVWGISLKESTPTVLHPRDTTII